MDGFTLSRESNETISIQTCNDLLITIMELLNSSLLDWIILF